MRPKIDYRNTSVKKAPRSWAPFFIESIDYQKTVAEVRVKKSA